jgi:cysteine synthase A
MLELTHVSEGNVFAKAEYLNPAGSVKDRVALYLIEEAEKRGELHKGKTIVEATSGNTGIGVAFVGVHKGYRVVIYMPDDMSEERKKIIKALGAEMVETPASEGIPGAVRRVKVLAAEDPDVWVVNQFSNPDNPKLHNLATGPEIWRQMEGRVDAFVAGVGSGGTIQGVGTYLKERNSEILVAAVEPKNSAALLGHEPGLHKIQGIGDGFIPEILDPSLIDEVITVSDDDAIEMTRRIARLEGALVGTSSGANVWAALQLAERLGRNKNVITMLPDRAERYFSTALL